ncbi:MAG TPA: hypothetical protein VEI02_09620 [Planctomycetota bacterium]|nr:hypothetical protein [Planctomycetota bacterium]
MTQQTPDRPPDEIPCADGPKRGSCIDRGSASAVAQWGAAFPWPYVTLDGSRWGRQVVPTTERPNGPHYELRDQDGVLSYFWHE